MNRILIWTLTALLCAGTVFAQKKPPTLKSQKEQEAWQAVTSATTPDARIKAVDDFLTNFADTDLKSIALFAAAQASMQKGDIDKGMVYGQQALDADPDNFDAALLLAGALAQRTKEFDLDREEKLAKAEKYANAAIEAAGRAQKPNPNIPDPQWEQFKKEALAQGHERLGMVADKRKKFDVAIAEYKQAAELAPDSQSPLIRMAASQTSAGHPDDALATLDKLSAMPNLNPAMKPYIDNERKKATAAKGGGAKPAAAPAPGANAPAAPAPQPAKP